MNYERNYYDKKQEEELLEFFVKVNKYDEFNNTRVVWEWLLNAPCFEKFQLEKSPIWKENNEIVAFMHLTIPRLGDIYINNISESEDLLINIVEYAEKTFSNIQDDKKYLTISLGENQKNLKDILIKQNYNQITNEYSTLLYDLKKDIQDIQLPEGFVLKTLSEVYDFDRLNKIIWEAFEYKGEVPKFDDDVNPLIKHAWLNYNKDICSVVVAPDGSYASFCGFWYEDKTKTGYLEPMVTAKKYHNYGLGKAVVFNSLKILKSYGCKKVFVDPDEKPYNYYVNIGFEKVNYIQCYNKVFE